VSCARLVVAVGEVDLASGALWDHDPIAVEEEALGDGRVSLLAGFADAATAAQVVAALPARWEPTVEAAPPDATWRDAWRAHAEALTVAGIRLWPSWWAPEVPPYDGVTVLLDPGWAFGSGSHASTRMALRVVAERVRPGMTMLDVGSGSGVLAVAAALLGASEVLAVDVDPEARRATTANAAANGMAARLSVAEHLPAADDDSPSRRRLPGAGSQPEGRFDLVVANIGAAVLADLAPAIVAAVAPGGILILGGLLVEQAAPLAAIYCRRARSNTDPAERDAEPGEGLSVEAVLEDAGWSTLVLRR
jgi:ribosomal protein L11 methyltransferase